MKFQFEKTYHDLLHYGVDSVGYVKVASLVNNTVMGEKYRYVLNIRWRNTVYHFSVFAVETNYEKLIDGRWNTIIKESKQSRLAQSIGTNDDAVKFNLVQCDPKDPTNPKKDIVYL